MAQTIHYPLHINVNGSYTPQGKVLGGVTVNTKGSGGNTLTIYNGVDATAPVLAVLDTTSALGTFLYDLLAINGLFVVLAGGDAADLTIASY